MYLCPDGFLNTFTENFYYFYTFTLSDVVYRKETCMIYIFIRV